MFNENMKHPEFVYIFEDTRNIATPTKTNQIADNLQKARLLQDKILEDFLTDLTLA